MKFTCDDPGTLVVYTTSSTYVSIFIGKHCLLGANEHELWFWGEIGSWRAFEDNVDYVVHVE